MKRIVLISFALVFQCIAAESVTIFNKSDEPTYAAIYYISGNEKQPIERATEVVKVEPFESISLEKPALRREGYFSFYDRDLVVAHTNDALKNVLSRSDYQKMLKTNVGTIRSWSQAASQLASSPFILTNLYKATGPAVFFVKINDKPHLLDPGLYNIFVQKQTLDDVVGIVKAVQGFVGVYMLVSSQEMLHKIRTESKSFLNDPYRAKKAKVRIGNQLSPEERAAQEARISKVEPAIEKFLEKKPSVTPRIAMVASGGGYRAMLCTLGFLTGAQEIGLLDATTWFVGLSGSTWAGGVLYMNEVKSNGSMTVRQIRDQTIQLIAHKDLYNPLTDNDLRLLNNYILVRAASMQPFSAVVLWGALIANRLFANFGDDRQNLHLWQMQPLVEKGDWPIPIFTAVNGEKGFERQQREWFEFTPWEVGSAWLEAYVPSWAYGRGFLKGESDLRLGENLGFNLGTFGSAIAVSFGDIIQELEKEMELASGFTKYSIKGLKLLVDQFAQLPPEVLAGVTGPKGYSLSKGGKVADIRLFGAIVHNFMMGMPQAKIQGPYMQLVDAGLAFNLPYPPISGERPERKADIIIFLDASSDIKEAGLVVNQLRLAEQYAQRKKLKFPKIDYSGLEKKVVSIFKDDTDPSVPVVIYLPRLNVALNEKDTAVLSYWSLFETPEFAQYKDLKNFDLEACTVGGDCNTFNFKYTQKNARLLSMTTEFNIIAAKDAIKRAINDWVMLKEKKE